MADRSVLLDGDYVNADTVTPAKHRYLGMYRPPVNPIANPTSDVWCICGEILRYRGQEHEHYRRGCFDVPQYVTIKEQTRWPPAEQAKDAARDDRVQAVMDALARIDAEAS